MTCPRRDSSGIVGAEVLPFVVLVFIGGTLVFAQAWAALDAKIAATAGAREAARSFVEHRGPRSGDAADDAIVAGTQAMSGYRLAGEASVQPVGAVRLRRCERATFEVTREVPAPGAARRGAGRRSRSPLVPARSSIPSGTVSTGGRPVSGERSEPEHASARAAGGGGDSPCIGCERGSALLLAPTGVLIVALLASIAVDSTAAFLAQREAQAAASSLANDLASLALDEPMLRRRGSYRVDPSRLQQLRPWSSRMAEEQLSAVFEPGSISVTARAAGAEAVRVSVQGSAPAGHRLARQRQRPIEPARRGRGGRVRPAVGLNR